MNIYNLSVVMSTNIYLKENKNNDTLLEYIFSIRKELLELSI